jgi:hypothetical protein
VAGANVTDDIDIIAAALTGDRQAVLKDQLRRIDLELIGRLAVNLTTRHAIHELIAHVRADQLRIEAPHEGVADDPMTLRERMGLQREFRALVRELSEEQRSCWHDTQALKAEARLLEKELMQLHQRDRRLGAFK